jgi:hypothetical protein
LRGARVSWPAGGAARDVVNLKGEPNLFCWKEDDWFFAEAKRKDPFVKVRGEWSEVFEGVLSEPPSLRLHNEPEG